MYGARINELDLRVAKTVKYRGLRSVVALDIYNALNSSAVLAYNPAFVPGGTWVAAAVMTSRLLKITAEVDF